MSSYREGKEWVRLYLVSHFKQGSTCLDVGSCDGIYSDILSDHFIMDAVEVYTPNVYNNSLIQKYRNIFVDNIVNLTYDNYDVILFGDVLEHLTVEEAQQVLEYAKTKAKEIIVAIPFGYEQGALYGNPFEIHKQGDLTEQLFNERYHGFTPLYITPNVYAYYKLETTPLDYNAELLYASNEINNVILYNYNGYTTHDYGMLMRGCYDYIYAANHLGIPSEIYSETIIPHMQKCAEGIETKKALDSRRFWIEFSNLTKNINMDSYKASLTHLAECAPEVVTCYNALLLENQDQVDVFYDLLNVAVEFYYLGDKQLASFYNKRALEIHPNHEIALANQKYYDKKTED